MHRTTRRQFLQTSLRTSASLALAGGLAWHFDPLRSSPQARGQEPGERPMRDEAVKVLNPRRRVPLSFIIDDSTCLVNLAHFCIPQFAEVFPDRYLQDWRKLPREIPDAFVRKFGEWCREQGVKGKYSIVPYPACVGWIDREMPGWTRKELVESVKLVRDFMTPDWDIHPEMVTHTWAVNTKTGRPYEERSEKFMENWGFSVGKSADELTDYLAFALKLLKNAGLPCEGITTPGGFGNRVLPELAQATLQSVRDVFGAEIPHYFRHLYTEPEISVAPQVQYASGLEGGDPHQCVVSIIGCTGDWFGGWDGLEKGTADQFITQDGKGGRLPEVIAKGEPAILVCHWPGIYFNGEEYGFNVFKEVVARLNAHYDNLLWMKNSQIARYWAARELTKIERSGNTATFSAPFACPAFTVELPCRDGQRPEIVVFGKQKERRDLSEVRGERELKSGAWWRQGERVSVCFDLPKGRSEVAMK
jgi:hypothetical protein